MLIAFCISVIFSVITQIYLAFKFIPDNYMSFIYSIIVCISVNSVIFWNGIICVYLSSTQLGIKLRVIGIVCGLIPIANLIVLLFIIKTTLAECILEIKKETLNNQRCKLELCRTKYPILLVHGVFFRDNKYYNYWGRIPRELEANGAKIYYGNHHSASSIADSATELKNRIIEILNETNSEKINIIAHSKGGLDCRYMISKLGMSDRVASLTTINTPHKGCLFADYLLNVIPPEFKNKVADAYNSTLKKFGEEDPDFLAAVSNLTESYCNQLESELEDPKDVYCQSVGSVLTKATSGSFPLNLSYHLVNHFSGENDGLVDENSFKWGNNYTLLRSTEKYGISHGDMIDLNRKNFKTFDVREFYVNLVNNLKNNGF